jgi:protein ImuA
MIEQLHQRLQALQKSAVIGGDPGTLPLGIAAVDEALGGGLARGALHEIAASGEAHLAAATGFTLGLAAQRRVRVFWIAEDMALSESGALHGPGLDVFNLAPERLLTVAAAHRRDLLWAMEEALRCRAIGAVIGELRHGELDAVAVRRLSLAAADNGALALLLRAAPVSDVSTAATRWIVGAVASSHLGFEFGPPSFDAHLVRNRRGPTGSWILEWSNSDEHFVLTTPAQPMAVPALDRPHRKVA